MFPLSSLQMPCLQRHAPKEKHSASLQRKLPVADASWLTPNDVVKTVPGEILPIFLKYILSCCLFLFPAVILPVFFKKCILFDLAVILNEEKDPHISRWHFHFSFSKRWADLAPPQQHERWEKGQNITLDRRHMCQADWEEGRSRGLPA